MEKYILIDCRMRELEKNYLESLGYKLIEINSSQNLYHEISSHVDIFCAKINDKLVVEKSKYKEIKNKINSCKIQIIEGEKSCFSKYPDDVQYNICQIGNYVVHNFNFTDNKILEIIEKEKLDKIQISQGYSNCSIAVIDENSVIVTDKKIAEVLTQNKINVLCLDYVPDIKLFDENKNYSRMNGFIGGAIARVKDKIIIFGDLEKIDKDNRILNFVKSHNLEIVEFKNLDVIDYGGIVVI